MEGIGLDNMLSAEQVEKMFSNQEPSEDAGGAVAEEPATEIENNDTNEEAAEVDFSDLLGSSSESVGSGEKSEGTRGAPESDNDSGTPQNLFSSIARILRDKGVFPDLSDKDADAVQDEAALEKLFNDKVSSMLDDRQRRIEQAMNSGASTGEMQQYENAVQLFQFLNKRETADLLNREGDDGEKLRKQVMYQDYVNRGFKHERAVKLIEKSFADGTDIDDAKEALQSCKEYYQQQIDAFQQELEDRKKQQQDAEQQQYNNLKKSILDKESFFDGVKVDKATRQKAYDAITKPVHKDEQGNYMNELQKYQREHPMEYVGNVALLYALTDGFQNVKKLAAGPIKAGLKKGFAELESVLNSTSRNGDGTLNLANTSPDNRENWTLAV